MLEFEITKRLDRLDGIVRYFVTVYQKYKEKKITLFTITVIIYKKQDLSSIVLLNFNFVIHNCSLIHTSSEKVEE